MSLYDHANVLPDGCREIDVATLKPHVGTVRIVDVREPYEYTGELGHVAGAELVPLNTVGQAAAQWDKAQEIVLVCKSGGRSGQATRWLQKNGFQKVINLRGGMLAWNDAKLPTER